MPRLCSFFGRSCPAFGIFRLNFFRVGVIVQEEGGEMKSRKTERGQAIGELAVGLLGLCFVMVGVLAMAMLGMTGIRNAVEARTQAEEYSISGNQTGNVQHITDWTDPDGLPFTADDTPRTAAFPNAVTFTRELADNTGNFRTAYLAKTSYADHAFESKYVESNLFLSAARLTMSEKIVSDPLSRYRHFDAARILRAFGMPYSFTIRDRICMPVNEPD